MDTFKVNGKIYTAKDFDFNLVCDMWDKGVALEDYQKKPVPTIRAYVALCGDIDLETAGNEIQAHMIANGSLNDIAGIVKKKLEESDFFRSLSEGPEKEEPENPTPKRASAKK